MATSKDRVQIEITAKNLATGTVRKFNRSLFKMAAAVTGVIVAFRSISKLTRALTNATNIQERALLTLARGLASVGTNTKEVRADFQAFASALQETTTVGDDEILNLGGIISSLGRLSGETLKRATAASLDFAAALGIDNRAAAINVAKAATGYASVLARYGIQVDSSKNKTEQLASVLDQIDEKFGGAAAVVGKTFAGAIRRVNNDFGDMLEVIGSGITESAAFRNILEGLSTTFKELGVKVLENREALDAFLVAITKGILWTAEAGLKLAKALLNLTGGFFTLGALIEGGFEGRQQAIKDLEALLVPLQALDDGIDAIQQRIKELEAAEKGVIISTDDVAESFGNADVKINQFIADAVDNMLALGINLDEVAKKEKEIRFLVDNFNEISQTLGLSRLQLKAFVDGLTAAVEEMNKLGAEIVFEPFAIAIEQGQKTNTLAKDINQTIGRGGAQAAADFGVALTSASKRGEEGFSKFFTGLLRKMGEAILKAIILQTIMAGIGGVFGGGAPAAVTGGGGGAPLKFAKHGGRVTGGRAGRDSVLAALTPGEIVLPAGLSAGFDAIASLAQSITGAGASPSPSQGEAVPATVNNTFSDINSEERALELAEIITDAVERKGVKLTASNVLAGAP